MLVRPDQIHFMLDLETLSTEPNAVILTAALVPFGRDSANIPSLYVKFDYKLFSPNFFGICQTTLSWWKCQNKDTWEEATSGTETPMIGLRRISNYLSTRCDVPIIWAKGVSFDIPILEHAFNYHTIPVPWHYSNVMCMRTLQNLYPAIPSPNSRPHSAIHDATAQAKYLTELAVTYDIPGIL